LKFAKGKRNLLLFIVILFFQCIVICFSGVGLIQNDGKCNEDDFQQQIYFDNITNIFGSDGKC
jgi:hypothetical protein